MSIQVTKISQDSKSAFSNFAFAAERKNKVGMLKNLSDSNIDVGVDAVESREAADIGQPAGRAHLDFPGFGRFD